MNEIEDVSWTSAIRRIPLQHGSRPDVPYRGLKRVARLNRAALHFSFYKTPGPCAGSFLHQYGESFAVFFDNVRVCLGVFKNLIAEAVFYEIDECLTWNCADARACRRERDDEFTVFIHNAERPDATVEGFVFRLQDAAFVRVQEGTGDLFFGGTSFVAAKNNLTVAKLPHHAVFIGFTEFFHDFGREKRGFPEALPTEGTAELAGGALFF